MAPPHFCLSWIHLQYASLGLPKKPSVYCSGLPATVSAITLLHSSPQVSSFSVATVLILISAL